MDFLDKETKKFLLILLLVAVFSFILLPLFFRNIDRGYLFQSLNDNIKTFIYGFNIFSNEIGPKPQNDDLEKNKNYTLTISTSEGDISIDLFEQDTPENIKNLIYLSKYYNNATFDVSKNYTIKVKINKKINYNTKDEINADNLNLDKIKVKDAQFLQSIYNSSDPLNYQFSQSNLSKYADFTLKEFYSEILGYTYINGINTPKAVKYIVYMDNNGPNSNKGDFFILMANYAPELDGRYTAIGRVTQGFDILNKINQNNKLKILGITVNKN